MGQPVKWIRLLKDVARLEFGPNPDSSRCVCFHQEATAHLFKERRILRRSVSLTVCIRQMIFLVFWSSCFMFSELNSMKFTLVW